MGRVGVVVRSCSRRSQRVDITFYTERRVRLIRAVLPLANATSIRNGLSRGRHHGRSDQSLSRFGAAGDGPLYGFPLPGAQQDPLQVGRDLKVGA